MNTDARRRANATYFKRREDAGLKRVTVWLTPEARKALEWLGVAYGSKDAAVSAGLLALIPEKVGDD